MGPHDEHMPGDPIGQRAAAPGVIRFPPFELRPAERLLLRDGQPQKLGGRAFDLLVTLALSRDRVVSKAELFERVWPRLVVEENNLQVQVMALRRLLGGHAIATVPGRGYRFTAPVSDDEPAAPSTPWAVSLEASPFVGREADLRGLIETLLGTRQVTLLGAGGVGKSTLARHAAQALGPHFRDGSFWIDLTPLTDGDALPDAIAAVTHAALPGGERLRALCAALSTMQALMVIDNAEHLLEDVVRVAKALHDAVPALHLLITSQAPLRLSFERLHRLEPLALADPGASLEEAARTAAVELFVQRVRASDRHFVLDPLNVAAVVSLTRRLDGLPLAIEMAAARVPALSPAQLDAALRERFRVLTVGDPTAPARQHSLQAAMRWTHDLMGAAEQAVFRRLAVFVGGFALDAAQAVCADESGNPGQARESIDDWQVLDALAALVDRSLVTPPIGDPPRYRLLETPLAFARSLLQASGELGAVRQRHARWCRAYFEQIYEDHLLARRSPRRLLDGAEHEADNGLAALATALEGGDRETACSLAPGLAQSLRRRHADRFAVWHRSEQVFGSDLPAAPAARWQLGWAQFWGINSLSRSQPHAIAAAALFRAERHAAGEYRALAILAGAIGHGGQADAAATEARMAELEDPGWPADLRFLRPWTRAVQLSAQAHHDEALSEGERCMALLAEAGRPARLVHEVGMMFVEIMAGRLDAAVARGTAAAARMRQQVRYAPASGVEILLVAAWLLRGDTAPARDMGPALWAAGRAFEHQGAVAEIVALLAALESRPRAALVLLGFAAAAHARAATQRLAVYRLCSERAREIAASPFDASQVESLLARGAALGEGAVPAVAFAAADLA